jgi:catechol-2,3-dioxygenase
MYFQSIVMNVADLDRSLEFYQEVYGFELLSRKDQLAAIHIPGTERPQLIILRAIGSARVLGARHIGMRALVTEVATLEELKQIEIALEKRNGFVSRRDGSSWTAVFGRDPDRIAVVAGCSLTGGPITLEAWASLDPSLYGVGE